jgi:uncharacterized phiE125 gp8 family phage protein
MHLVLIDPPDVEPLSSDEIMARLNIASDPGDTLSGLITAARQGLDGEDGYLGRALNTQTWQLMLPGFPWHHHHNGCVIVMPLPPLQQINSISYIDEAGVSQVLDPSQYMLNQGARPFLVPQFGKVWPNTRAQPDAVTIEFIAGYGPNGSDVPEPIRAAIAIEVNKLRSLTARDQNVMIDNVIGMGSKTYAAGRDSGTDTLTAAAQALLHSYRVLR